MPGSLKAFLFTLLLAFCVGPSPACSAEWSPKKGPLQTRWAKDVKPENVHPEYPRPQFVRDTWQNLNGLWDYAITAKDAAQPTSWTGKILVPFPVESSLSGVMETVGPEKRLWYHRTISKPGGQGWNGRRILLHFGAVDWECELFINQKSVGKHRGGYDPFSFDITDALHEGNNEIILSVYDPSDAGYQPRGKQVQKPGGIFYTSTTGIWQTVWLEPVSATPIRNLAVTTDLAAGRATIQFETAASGPVTASIAVPGVESGRIKTTTSASNSGVTVKSEITGLTRIWSPESPQLYDYTVELKSGDQALDHVQSYFAMRSIELKANAKGLAVIHLNGKPYFQYGPLDQGFWPDGLYTAATDEALRYDIEQTKKMGFNVIRKHVKVEPARWYTHCDRLGMLVWQDMPAGDKSPKWGPEGQHDGEEITRSQESADNFRHEWKTIMEALKPFPCIVMWIPFNEAWGQFDTVAITKWTEEFDPTRLVNCASGGNDFPVGDVLDRHRYPGPFAPKATSARASVLGEFGGLGLPLDGHTWQSKDNWGYRTLTSETALTSSYLDLMDRLAPMVTGDDLSAAIYTQTTDVEVEVNGLMTYDREITKIPVEVLKEAHQSLTQPGRVFETLVPTSEKTAQFWLMTEDEPKAGWQTASDDDLKKGGWVQKAGGFGDPGTPGAVVKTQWRSPRIALRKTFNLKEIPAGTLRLRIHHDEDAKVYLNGTLIREFAGYSSEYQDFRLTPDTTKLLKVGENTVAIECVQTRGGQYIDAGLVISGTRTEAKP